MVSRPVSTVAPVVLRPDIVSKNASVKRQARQRDQQRHGRDGRHEDPAQGDEQEAVARPQFALVTPGQRDQASAGGQAAERRIDEVDEQAVGIDQRRHDRQQVGDAEQHQHRPEDVDDGKHQGDCA